MLFPALAVKEALGTPFPPSFCRVRHRLHLLLVFQDGIVGLVDVLGHFWSSAFQGELWKREERLVLEFLPWSQGNGLDMAADNHTEYLSCFLHHQPQSALSELVKAGGKQK